MAKQEIENIKLILEKMNLVLANLADALDNEWWRQENLSSIKQIGNDIAKLESK